MARSNFKAKYENSWAVVVGINAYEHASPLDSACNDAKVFADTLTARFGFSVGNVSVLLDKSATLRGVQSAIHGLTRNVGEDDRVVFFYAGHGLTVPAHGGRNAGFLVPVDGRPDDTATLLPWDDLVNTSRIIPAKHMLFVMDACYGGLIGMRALQPGSRRFARDMLSRYSRQFLTAGKADEPVADCGGPRKGHSVFTGHLLDALDGGLNPPDGLVSANSVMAYVYDRVSKDPHSKQAPHYGFLAGDGDFFFAPPADDARPNAEMPTDDAQVEVPPDLVAPEEVTVAPPLLDQVKVFISDHSHRIRLNDLVMRELRAAQQRLGEANFSVESGSATKEEFTARLLAYETAISDLLGVSVLLGRWSEPEQQGVVRQLVNVIAGQVEGKGGNTLWLALRSYPMLLLMYAGGIAALEGDNYQGLKSLLLTEVHNHRRGTTAAVVQATTDAMLDVTRTDAFKLLPGHERHYTPMSEYLFKRMQPTLEDVLFLGPRYELLFDKFEVFYALTYVDLSEGDWGHPGRFAWKFRLGGGEDPFSAMLKEAKRDGDSWPPLKAGMFRSSVAHFLSVAERFKERMLGGLGWH